MSDQFFERPILNSPYEYPSRHWELDDTGQPTTKIKEHRRGYKYVTPVPKVKKRGKNSADQGELTYASPDGISDDLQQYDPTPIINGLRDHVHQWRMRTDPSSWQVTPETARLLQHWRHHDFSSYRPFFCQVEAVETLIWITEVAPKLSAGKDFIDHLEAANEQANPGLARVALKLATGAGKTTVMAMIIAWQTINAVRRPNSRNFTRGFLVVTPGITIRDRLRVLLPNDPENYYKHRELVPSDMLEDLHKAKIVITNFHAFKLRETMDLSKGGRALLQGRGEAISTIESEGQMLQRVIPDLMGMRGVMVLNDEAHHCYRERPMTEEEAALKGDDRKEAEKNREAARLWISGLEIAKKKLGVRRIVDLSATPFFLRGSGYHEGTLFPWTMSDFSLMDAIECGIVKLPRVPVADNIPGEDVPVFRNLWEHIGKRMPKKGRGKSAVLDPEDLPTPLRTALEALYGHYEKTFEAWQESNVKVPPCFIVVCNNTSTSKLLYDYISGYERENEDGTTSLTHGAFELFRNFDDHGNPYPRPRTILIDSEQLESGEALDKTFHEVAADEIERFRREIRERSGGTDTGEKIADQELLREVMNTVGKENRLGGPVRCVVSVSMLTEGWDANTVTHILGVRAFGTQLLCEQVVGRALRRLNYELNEEGLFGVEYADVLGVPFDFNAKPVIAPVQPPPPTVHVMAVSPERDHLEIRFPRVQGYRTELPEERLAADFNDESVLELTPGLLGPSETQNQGLIGEGIDLNLVHTGDLRPSTILFYLTKRLLEKYWRDPGGEPKMTLFGQLKRVAKQWIDTCLVCKGGTYPAQLMFPEIADRACECITDAITVHHAGENPIKALLDPYNPTGSTRHVNFRTSKQDRWETDAQRCHVNWAMLDSNWEAEFCRVAEVHPRVLAYVKNHNLGLEVPYRLGGENHMYVPDFVVLVDDGQGMEDPLHLVVETKGYRGEDAKAKKLTMDTYWIPGVNNLKSYGRWAFAEFCDVYDIQADFAEKVEEAFNAMIDQHISESAASG